MIISMLRGGLTPSKRLISRRPFSAEATARSTVSNPSDVLMDSHGRKHTYLRISLTEKCNLRCEYCMPIEGVPLTPRTDLLTGVELTRLVKVLAACGVNKLRLTGGEPSVRRDLEDVVQTLSSTPGISAVAMTSNGAALVRRLAGLQRAGLSGLNLSLDSLRPQRWAMLARRPATLHTRVVAAADLALQLGIPLKLNVVLMRGVNDDEIGEFVEFTRDRALDVRFIEFMPFSGNAWQSDKLVPYKEALNAAQRTHPNIQLLPPDSPNDTAKVWGVPGYVGRVGFITSMTQNFCGSCNRLRLTADGNLKVCLFGASEVSLRDALRSGADDDEIVKLVRTALANKKPQHAGIYRGVASTERLAGTSPACCRNAPTGADGEQAHDTHRGMMCAARQRRQRRRARREQPRGGVSLSHVDSTGRARMVDVGDKRETRREAIAGATLHMAAQTLWLLRTNALSKGDAVCVAETAGVLAAKSTAQLIPLCHPLSLSSVTVAVTLPPTDTGTVRVVCTVRLTGRTGAEMEALLGAAVASLTLYDMCKAVDPGIVVSELRLLSKSGGKSDYPPARE